MNKKIYYCVRCGAAEDEGFEICPLCGYYVPEKAQKVILKIVRIIV